MSLEPVLDQVADAILDGSPVDWDLIDSSVTADAIGDRALVDQLKTLETLRRLRRTSVAPEVPGNWTWGHLQVFERIGQGAYGDVYRAWDTRLDREVALKLLPADVPSTGPSHSTIIEEGRLLARVRHPNVVTIHGAERIDGRVGLWMEFVKGRTLEEALRNGRTFTAEETTRLGVELCRAVSAVHAAGLLHRDIKAQNVMLDDAGRLVLMDFGTGRDLETTDKHIAGTPLYLAPEVLSGAAATAQSDAYSIGVVLFRLLTNTYPVSGGDLADLRRAHADGGDAGARLNRAGIPRRIRRVLARALDPKPERRYAGAEALAVALGATERTPARRRVVPIAAAVVALMIAGAASWNLGLSDRLNPALVALGVVTKTPTIAVLPFKNAGSDSGQQDFIDGLTNEVIRHLAMIHGLQVRSQTSSFFFQDRPRNLREIAERLDVDLVVEANVQRAGNRLRISAYLVRVPDDVIVWDDSFDRTIDDVFAIQEEISRAIANKLRLTIGGGQRRKLSSPLAIELYMRGRAQVEVRGTEAAKEGLRLFNQVIDIDPEFAPAYAGLAEAYAAAAWEMDGLSDDVALAAMRPAAERALALDPTLAEAHAAMGLTYAQELDWDNARKSFERAMQLNPTLSQIPIRYGASTLRPLGLSKYAVELGEAALKMDPLSLTVQRQVASAQYIAGRFDDAIANLREVLAVDPGFRFANNLLSKALTAADRPQDAIAVFENRQDTGDWERWLMRAYVLTGRQKDIDRLIEQHRTERPWRRALIYAGLMDKDRTFEQLTLAAIEQPNRVASVLQYPLMSFLRGDPRLDQLRTRLNLR